jgi:hypothetical protein
MPIRSPKGRGAAYRPIWQWPLRSPARLFSCVIAVIALAILANAGLHLLPGYTAKPGVFDHQAGPPTAGAAPTPEAAAPDTPTRLPPVPELTPRTLPPAEAPRAAITTATRWTEAWARHPAGTTTASWINGLRPFTTDEYLGVLSTVDPSNVPASKVTGTARAVLVSPSSVRVEVPTDAVKLVVLVVNTGGTDWRVAGYDRAADDTGSPADPNPNADSNPNADPNAGPKAGGRSPAGAGDPGR